MSPFRGKGFRAESSKRFSRPVSCPESPRNSVAVETRSPSHDDLIHTSKPSVHFNIKPPIPRKRSAIHVIDASATSSTKDDSFTSERFGDASYHDRDLESFEIVSNGNVSGGESRRVGSSKPLPAPRQHIHRSASSLSPKRNADLDDDSYFGQKQNINPRSYQRGLLGVVSGESESVGNSTAIPSRIPRRKSSISTPNIARRGSISTPRRDSRRESTSSSDRFSVRRDSSVSPRRRRIANEFGGSMIDLGTPKSPSRSANRISKPTSLSPIVGTPNNQDCEQGSDRFYPCDYDGGAGSGTYVPKYGMDSPTKIPVRRSSSVNIHGSASSASHWGSRASSRGASPMKSPLAKPPSHWSKSPIKSPTKIPQKITGSSPSKSAKMMNDSYRGDSSKSVHKEASSAKKEPAITREKSSVKKTPSTTAKRQPSTLKRENSQQKLKHEAGSSMIDIGGGSSSGKPAATKSSATRRTPPITNTLAKNQSDSSLAKRLEKKNSFKQKRRTSSESDGLNEMDTANLSDKLTPLTKTIDGASMTTAAMASQPVQITTAVTDHLSKKNSSGQIVNNDNSTVNNDSSNINNISTSNVSESNASGKNAAANPTADGATIAPPTPSTPQGGATITTTTTTTTVITDANAPGANEITSSVNLTTAKTTDQGVTISETTTSEVRLEGDKAAAAAAATVNEANANANKAPDAVLEKKASTRTLGGKSEAGSLAPLGTPIVPESIERELIGTPIETKVNVIDRNALMSTVNSEALQMNKPTDSSGPQDYQRNASSSTSRSGGGGGGGGGGVMHENRLIETTEKDNGITSNIDPLKGAKNEM